MNIANLIQGFNAYLELEEKNTNKSYVTTGDATNIFMYSSEFKDYMRTEIGIDIESMNITNLLNMEIENGKLVDPKEQQIETIFGKQEEENKTSNNEEAKSSSVDGSVQNSETREEKLFKRLKALASKLGIIVSDNEQISTIISKIQRKINELEKDKNNPNLNVIWQETIKGYGTNNGLNYYEKIYWNFINNINSIDKHILAGYKVVSNDQKRKSEYVLFKDISGLVPSIEDIYKAFNKMVITNIDNNYKFYVASLEESVISSLKYMEVNEMIDFYNAFKDVMKRNNANSNLYLELQKILAKEIRSRNKKEIELIIKEYLNEDVLS